MKQINSETSYNKALKDVYELMKKGEKNLTLKEEALITETTSAIQAYEAKHYPFPMPGTLAEVIELKMLEKKINRADLAELLEIGAPKLSQILNNKRPPDVHFLKAIHQKLGVDGNFILERV